MRSAETARRSATRSAARMAAVQALYQMDMAGTDVTDVVEEFAAHRFGKNNNGGTTVEADADFFRDIVTGVVREQRRIDPLLDAQLAEGWRLSRIDSILRAILRSGAFELAERTDVPAKVVISEYVEVAHAFFSGEEPRVVNGILDHLGRRLRAGELSPAPDA